LHSFIEAGALSALAQGPRVAVIGGSLGGMMAALALREVGCQVDVFERVSRRLEGHGAGLRIVPEMARLLRERAGIDLEAVSTFVRRFRHLGPENRIVSEVTVPGQFTSWGSLHRALSARFDADRYHLGMDCTRVALDAAGATVTFANGQSVRADLVVFADGILSTGRRLLAPEAQLAYAGYVTWRGYAPSQEVRAETRAVMEDSICYATIPYSHIGMYPIPDPTNRDAAARYYNFVWYRNVEAGAPLDDLMTDRSGVHRPISLPAGGPQQRFVDEVRADAQRLLPAAAADIVLSTREPFLQALYDLAAPRMVFGRACLVGDAAFATRPHAGAATAKASVNAWKLADCLVAAEGDIDAALQAWEPEQIELGKMFLARNQYMGRVSLVENGYNPTAPDQMPGLFGPGR
jgi:2,6-dihydroxypyridine 3-monooxygenase